MNCYFFYGGSSNVCIERVNPLLTDLETAKLTDSEYDFTFEYFSYYYNAFFIASSATNV